MIDSWVFAPVAVQHEPQDEYCRGDSTLITNAFGSYASYQWLLDYEPIPGANGPEYWVRESGTYVLNASPFECPELTLTSGIGPTFTFQGPEVPIINWDGSVLAASSGPQYQWLLNGSPIAGADAQTYEPVKDGLYSVRVSDGSGCAPVSTPLAVSISGTGQPPWAREFKVFPNPLRDILNIQPPRDAAFELRLFDAEGKEIHRQAHTGPGMLALTTGCLSPGLYFCRLIYRGETASFRLIKE